MEAIFGVFRHENNDVDAHLLAIKIKEHPVFLSLWLGPFR